MPVMLDVEAAKKWLSTQYDKEMLLSACRTDVDIYKVDRRVNNSREEGEDLILPV